MNEVRSYFAQGFQNEESVVSVRMWYDQSFLVHDEIFIEHDIEIYHPGPI